MAQRCIVNLAISERYVPLAQRLRASIAKVKEPAALCQRVNTFPKGTPSPDMQLPDRAYCAKPYAFLEALELGCETLLWVDASCMLIKPLDPLWEHIEQHGHYCQDNGWMTGQWCSDIALKTMNLDRETALRMPEISTCVLGLDMKRKDCQSFLREWVSFASDGVTFPGAHTNDVGKAGGLGVSYRSIGHVSDDPRVLGHRHDQTVASVLAWRREWERIPRPIFVGYGTDSVVDPRTLIQNCG